MRTGWEKIPSQLRAGLSNATLSELSAFSDDWPELELLPLAATTSPAPDTDNYASVTIAFLTPTSRGDVTITSANTNENLVISPSWLLTKSDQEGVVQGLKRARQIAAATGITVGPEVFPAGR